MVFSASRRESGLVIFTLPLANTPQLNPSHALLERNHKRLALLLERLAQTITANANHLRGLFNPQTRLRIAEGYYALGKNDQDQWYVRQWGYEKEQWDLFCLNPNASPVPAAESLQGEIALAHHYDAEAESENGKST